MRVSSVLPQPDMPAFLPGQPPSASPARQEAPGGLPPFAPFDTAAFEAAYRRNVPVFLVIGELTEAFAEAVHAFMRREMWGYETGTPPTPEQAVRGQYRGRRMAFGYPASPDHSLKREVFDLLAVEVTTGMRLTENWMIDPGEALCGLMFSDADYFSVGTIGAEQLLDYARRRGMEAETVKKIIPNNV